MNILFCSVGRRCELLKDFRKSLGDKVRLEYCEITGLEAGNLVDYFWEPGLPAVFTGSYQIYSNLSEENSASNSASGGN